MPKYIYRISWSWDVRIFRNKFLRETEKMIFFKDGGGRESRALKDNVYFSFEDAKAAFVKGIEENIEILEDRILREKESLKKAINLVEPSEGDD